MTGISLYRLADEYMEAMQKLNDLELDDQTIADTLEGLAGEIEHKATNVAMFTKQLDLVVAGIKEAEADMAARRKAVEHRAERVRAYLKEQMERTGITKIESPFLRVSLRTNPPRVVIDAANIIPDEYWRTPETPPPEPDKKKLLEAIREGAEVPGAHIERTTRVEIK